MFWSGETLESRLEQLIFDENEHPIGDPAKVDCSAYTLTIEPEIFITPSKRSEKRKGHQKIRLKDREDFVIPKGQFAFLLTEEYVKIPDNCMAFISLKTRSLKFKGLVNVSGFHVDPGYHGRILYSVFNAGPQDITLHRGQDFAMIWFASLDKASVGNYKYKPGLHNKEISTDITGPMNGEVFSPVVIKERLEQLETRMQRQTLGVIITIAIVFLGTAVNFSTGWLKERLFPSITNAISVGGGQRPLSIRVDGLVDEKARLPSSPAPFLKPESHGPDAGGAEPSKKVAD
jgi:dCTP deaminase